VTDALSIPVMTFRRLAEELPRWTYRFVDERQLHDGLAEALLSLGVGFTREHSAGPSRFDFFCFGGIVIEAKIKGSMMSALRQAERYCRQEDVSSVLLVAARSWGSSMHGELAFHGKPVRVVRIMGAAF
jgi:hypothetical protein